MEVEFVVESPTEWLAMRILSSMIYRLLTVPGNCNGTVLCVSQMLKGLSQVQNGFIY